LPVEVTLIHIRAGESQLISGFAARPHHLIIK
jgi:hypothetical protein